MNLSVFSVLYKDKPLGEVLDILKTKGVTHVEVGAGGFIGKEHCNPQILNNNKQKREAFVSLFNERGMTISALSCHGNPVHPNSKKAAMYDSDIKEAIALAQKIGVKTIVTFSGCPGGSDNDIYPNWPVSPFPEDFQAVFNWQWDKKLVPYWQQTGQLAKDSGVNLALELHGGYSVHSPYTAIKLREETGQASVGANLDPSHMWWQGINPAKAAIYLCKANCLFHFHAKDAKTDDEFVSYYGVTDMQSFGVAYGRGWQFRTVGYGHDLFTWRNIISTLRANGYDGVISVEHEDSYMSIDEGLNKAIANLNQVIVKQPASTPQAFKLDNKFL